MKFAAAVAAAITVISGGAMIVATTMGQSTPATSQSPQVAAQLPAAIPEPVNFDAAAARKAIITRFQALQNLTVSSDSEQMLTPAEVTNGIPRAVEQTVSILGANLRIEQSSEGLPIPNMPTDAFNGVQVLRKDAFEIWSHSLSRAARGTGNTADIGSITHKLPANFNVPPILVALGISRPWPLPSSESQLLSLSDLEQANILPTELGRVVMSRARQDSSSEEWEFRPDLGYAVTSYRITGSTGITTLVLADDFRPVDGLTLPFSTKMTVGAPEFLTQRIDVTVKEYKLSDPDNVQARYHLTWPEGTRVSVDSSGYDWVASKDGKLIGPDEIALDRFKQTLSAATTRPTIHSDRFAEPLMGIVLYDLHSTLRAAGQPTSVNLNTGRTVEPPLGPHHNEIDLTFERLRHGPPESPLTWYLRGADTLLFKVPIHAWDNPNPAIVQLAIANGDPGLTVALTNSGDSLTYVLGTQPQWPMVFAYRTHEGGTGIMRVNGSPAGDLADATIDLKRIGAP